MLNVLQRIAPIYRVCALQFGISLMMATAWFGESAVAAYSAFAGGLIAVIPQAYFTYKVFAKRGARAAREILRLLFAGEAKKMLLTACLFVMVFAAVKPLHAVALITTFIAAQLAHWLAPLVIK